MHHIDLKYQQLFHFSFDWSFPLVKVMKGVYQSRQQASQSEKPENRRSDLLTWGCINCVEIILGGSGALKICNFVENVILSCDCANTFSKMKDNITEVQRGVFFLRYSKEFRIQAN